MRGYVTVALVGRGESADALGGAFALLDGVAVRRVDAPVEDADVLVFAVPPEETFDLFVRAMRSGALLLLPLPATPDTGKLKRIGKSVKRYKLRLMCCHVARFRPSLARVKELVVSGVLGEPSDLSITAACSVDRLVETVDACCWLGGAPVDVVREDSVVGRDVYRVAFASGCTATVGVSEAGDDPRLLSTVVVSGGRGDVTWDQRPGGDDVCVETNGRRRGVPTVAGVGTELLAAYVARCAREGSAPEYVTLAETGEVQQFLSCMARD